MLQHPLLPLTISYVAGVVVAGHVPLWLGVAFVAAFGAATGALVSSRTRSWWLLAALFFAGLVNLTVRTAILSPHDLRLAAATGPSLITLRGRLVATPVLRLRGEGDGESVRSLAVIEAEALGTEGRWEPVVGRVSASTPAALPDGYFRGQRVEVFGVLRPPHPPRAPGLFDARVHFHWLGIYHQLDVRDTNDWRLAAGAAASAARPLADRFIQWAQRALARGLAEEDDAVRLMWAMTLGWRTALTGEVAAPFMQSGTMHVFAISGLHVMLIATVLVAVLRVCRVSRRVMGVLVVPCLWCYAGATGWQASAVRSTVMMTAVVGSWALERPGNLLNSLAGAGLALLVWEPRQLFQAGFQLSFFVVMSMALLLPAMARWEGRVLGGDPLLPSALRPWWRRRLDTPMRWLWLNLAVSLAAWLGSVPLIARYFHLVTPVSLLANLVVVPLSGLVLTSNLASLFCAVWLPWLGVVFNHAGWFWMKAMVQVSVWSAGLPGAFVWVRDPGLAWVALYYVSLVAVGGGWLLRPRLRWLATGALGLLVCVTLVQGLRGGGSATLFILPLRGGHAVWVDAPGRHEDLLVDSGDLDGAEQVIIPFLHAQGRGTIQNLALTHGDVRHVGGAFCVQSNLHPDRVWTSQVRFRSSAYRAYVEQCGLAGGRLHRVSSGDVLAGWEVLHPSASDAFTVADDSALVLRRRLLGVWVLLVSDLGKVGEAALLARSSELKADILVVSLPEGGQGLSFELLEAIRPGVTVLVDDASPATARVPAPVHRRLLAAGTPLVRTSDEGAVRIRLDSDHWSVACLSGREWQVPGKPLATPRNAF